MAFNGQTNTSCGDIIDCNQSSSAAAVRRAAGSDSRVALRRLSRARSSRGARTCVFGFRCFAFTCSVHARFSSCAIFVPSRAIFKPCSLQHAAFSPAPLLEMSLRQREPRALQAPFVFPPLRLCFGESNLLLTEMSARIKVSPIARVMLLKGLACILEAGSGSTLGCHMCRPGMRQNG